MIGRRFLAYFVVLSALLLVATVAFERFSMGRVIDHTVSQNLLLARSVARYVGDIIERDAKTIGAHVAKLPDELDDEKAREILDHVRGLNGRAAAITVLDGRRRVLASSGEVAALPPPEILLPALRKAQESKRPVVTDLWEGAGKRPRVALVIAQEKEDARRFVVAQFLADAEEFLDLFGFVQTHPGASLQLLDSRGKAIFSTREKDRYRLAVHGTFFVDKVRLGEPVVMECHSCHEDGQRQVRERVVTSVAPVPGTGWAVSMIESERDLYAPMRELIFASVALVVLFFGAFAAFFVLLFKRVLTPMRQIAQVAAGISVRPGETAPAASDDDELSVLARSFETIRQRAKQENGTNPAEDAAPKRPDQAAPREAAPAAVAAAGPLAERPAADIEPALAAVLAGLVRLDSVRSAILYVDGNGEVASFSTAHGARLGGSGAADPAGADCRAILKRVRAGRSWVASAELAEAGVAVEPAGSVGGFHVREVRLGERVRGELWIGTETEGGELAHYLAPAVDVLAKQIESIVERTLLFERLRKEHDLKNLMLRRLFEAEDEERKRIARELHDETAQLLTSLLLHFETFPPGEDRVGQARAIEQAQSRVEQILDGIDRLIRRLRPAVLDDLGLVEAIRTMGRNVLTSSGIEFAFTVETEPGRGPLSKETENTVYRVFQEAATNVLRHSGATRVQASLEVSTQLITAWIEDNGKGMDVSWMNDPTARPRWGVLGMRERVVQTGGTIRFSAPEGGGLRIDLEVPVGAPPR